jgi:hypothetical protein
LTTLFVARRRRRRAVGAAAATAHVVSPRAAAACRDHKCCCSCRRRRRRCCCCCCCCRRTCAHPRPAPAQAAEREPIVALPRARRARAPHISRLARRPLPLALRGRLHVRARARRRDCVPVRPRGARVAGRARWPLTRHGHRTHRRHAIGYRCVVLRGAVLRAAASRGRGCYSARKWHHPRWVRVCVLARRPWVDWVTRCFVFVFFIGASHVPGYRSCGARGDARRHRRRRRAAPAATAPRGARLRRPHD